MKLVNLTPHAITLVNGDDSVTLQPSGVVARVRISERVESKMSVEGLSIDVYRTYLLPNSIEGLPEYDGETMYIASRLVVDAARKSGRTDVFSVHKTVRDEQGRIIGATGLAR